MIYKTSITLLFVVIAYHSCGSSSHEGPDNCDYKISKQFLSEPQLEPSPLAYRAGKTYWLAAATLSDDIFNSYKIDYEQVENNQSTANFYAYDWEGNITNSGQLAVKQFNVNNNEVYETINEKTAVYSFLCGDYAIAEYHCQIDRTGTGAKYRVMAPIEQDASAMEMEVYNCIDKITTIDISAATQFNLKSYPCCWL